MIEDGAFAGLGRMTPGPVLAAVLDGVELRAVPNDDVLEVLTAHHRQTCHDQAWGWAAIDEVLHRRRFAGPGEVRRADTIDVDGSDEVRAALTWTRRAAEAESWLAHTIVCELPDVWAAVAAGSLDRIRAQVFARHLGGLPATQVAAVCETILPDAPRLTSGQLDERIKRLLLEIDPDWFDRRYRKALRDRRVVHYLDENGAAVLTARGLAAEEAAAALARVDRLARAARRAGHPATLDQIRADVLIALLDGSVHGLSRDQIVAALIVRHAAAGRDPGEPADETASGTRPDDGRPDGGGPEDGEHPDSTDPDGDGAGGPEGDGPDDDGPEGGGSDGDRPAERSRRGAHALRSEPDGRP